jgi:acetyltransferase-like isoleucine patch superfamily enzyme
MSLTDAVAARARRAMALAVHRGWEWLRRHGEISPSSPAGRRFGRLGDGSCIGFPPGAVFGEPWIHIGAGTLVGSHVTMSAGMAPGLDLGPEPLLRIGDRCSVGRGSHIVAHQSIEIGNDVYTGPYVYITDQNHAYTDPDTPIGRQWPVNDPVVIGPGCWLGAGAIILPGARLGANVAVAAGAVVRGVFPDRCLVAGVPARIVRRFDPVAGWEAPAPTAAGAATGTAAGAVAGTATSRRNDGAVVREPALPGDTPRPVPERHGTDEPLTS